MQIEAREEKRKAEQEVERVFLGVIKCGRREEGQSYFASVNLTWMVLE